jgi:hypothetical protein
MTSWAGAWTVVTPAAVTPAKARPPAITTERTLILVGMACSPLVAQAGQRYTYGATEWIGSPDPEVFYRLILILKSEMVG